jgi:hypothetical protein
MDLVANASNAEERSWDFLATGDVAILYIIQLILSNGWWKYDMTSKRVESWYWMQVLSVDPYI